MKNFLFSMNDTWVIFTDDSSTGKAAYVYGDITVNSSSSSCSVIWITGNCCSFSDFLNQPLNIYTYSACSVPLLETAGLIKSASEAGKYFSQLQYLICQHTHHFFLGYLRAHSGLPGPLAKGNELADLATHSNVLFCTDLSSYGYW